MTGTWEQVEEGKGGATGQGKSVTGSRQELLVASQKGREAQTSGGGRKVGAPSRWMVSTCPGELGRRSDCKEIEKWNRRLKDGGEIGVRFGGGNGDAEHS